MSGFSYNSRRSKDGFAFQDKLLTQITTSGIEASDVRQYFAKKGDESGRTFTTLELCNFEHRFGDIRIVVDETEYWVECVTINQEKSIFPERKVKKFRGRNRFYAFRVMEDHDTVYFLPSGSWNCYAKKMENMTVHGKPFRRLAPKNILTFRNKIVGLDKFLKSICKTG
jgi:hypothetical protein